MRGRPECGDSLARRGYPWRARAAPHKLRGLFRWRSFRSMACAGRAIIPCALRESVKIYRCGRRARVPMKITARHRFAFRRAGSSLRSPPWDRNLFRPCPIPINSIPFRSPCAAQARSRNVGSQGTMNLAPGTAARRRLRGKRFNATAHMRTQIYPRPSVPGSSSS
jgi:hypothetical protein